MKQIIVIMTLAATLSLSAGLAYSADQNEPIYGSQLMTQQERIEYRARIMNAETMQEREEIRNEHHQMMQERAKARGLTLPQQPPMGGMGKGLRPRGN